MPIAISFAKLSLAVCSLASSAMPAACSILPFTPSNFAELIVISFAFSVMIFIGFRTSIVTFSEPVNVSFSVFGLSRMS